MLDIVKLTNSHYKKQFKQLNTKNLEKAEVKNVKLQGKFCKIEVKHQTVKIIFNKISPSIPQNITKRSHYTKYHVFIDKQI